MDTSQCISKQYKTKKAVSIQMFEIISISNK